MLRHIATGGMAAVHAAADELLGREVAVKVLADGMAADASARERFTREARAAARVSDHPNVVTVYDIGETDDDPPAAFIVMELLAGGTVADRLKSGDPIPHTLALRWLEQAAAALDAAHASDIVHRDVKPANLLLDAQGTLKVADFGIASMATDDPLTKTGQVIGTAAYFSPEQALGRPATAASDRYALAVLAFELLTGQRPFPAGTPAAQALAHADREPPAATSIAPGLPNPVDAVLARGLAKDPAARPASAGDLVRGLHDALGPTATTGVAHPIAAADRTEVRIPHPSPISAPREPRFVRQRTAPVAAAEPPKRSRAGVLAAVAALLLVAGGAIAAIAGSGGGDTLAATPPTTAKKQPAKTTPSPAPAAQAPEQTPTQDAPTGPQAPADAAQIQADAHDKLAAGDYAGAIGALQPLVERCDVAITDPCAYAWFDLGYALRRAGDPAAAIPVLEHRLENPDQAATVQAELDAARAEAEGATAPPGKAKGHEKKAKKDD